MITIGRKADLTRMCRVENMSGVVFTGENGGHKFVITAHRGEEIVPLTGSVTGKFIRPNGYTVELAGSNAGLEDGNAWVTLAGNCYTEAGPFGLTITHIENGNRTVIYACTGYVHPSQTGTIVDPESIINVDAIAGMISDLQEAIASAEGVTDEVDELKSAIDIVTADVSVSVGSASRGYWEIANDVATKQSASSGYYHAFNPIAVSEGQQYKVVINCNSSYAPIILADYTNNQYAVVDTKTVTAQRTPAEFEFTIPSGVTHMLLTRFGNAAPGATVTYKGQRVDATLSVAGVAADAKATGDAIGAVDAKTDALNDGIAYADKQIEKINDALIKSVGEGQPILRNKIINLNYGGNFVAGSDSTIRVATDPVYVPDGAKYTVTASGFGRVAYTRSGNGTTIYDGHNLAEATTYEHTFTGPEYFRIEFANATDTNITPNDITITITNSAAVLTDLVEKTEGIYPASNNVFVKIGDSIGSNIVATYKKMYVRNNNGVIQLSTDSGQTWNAGFDVSSLGLINNYHLFANGCIGFYTHQKAYYSEDYETYTEAPVYEADGVTPYVPSEIVNFFTSRQDQNRKFIGDQDLYVFGNYVISNEENTRKVLFATIDNGHSYKVIYEFNITGNRSIRHVHYVVYDPNNDHYLVCTGDSDVQSYVIQLDYNSTNDTWTLTDLGHSIKYKWAGVAFYSNYVYFCFDNTPGKVCRCKYDEISDVSKHETVLDNLPCDAIGLYIGERGDIIVTLSSARTGTNNSPFGKIIDVHRVYYSADGVHFENFIGDNPGGYAESHYYSFLGVNEDGRAITGFKPYLTNMANWNKLPSFDLAEMAKKHGYINAMKPYDTTWEIRPVTAVECADVTVAVGSAVTIEPKLYPWNASKLDGLNFEIIDYDSTKVSVSGAVITGVAAGTTTARVRSRTTYDAYADITITVT